MTIGSGGTGLAVEKYFEEFQPEAELAGKGAAPAAPAGLDWAKQDWDCWKKVNSFFNLH